MAERVTPEYRRQLQFEEDQKRADRVGVLRKSMNLPDAVMTRPGSKFKPTPGVHIRKREPRYAYGAKVTGADASGYGGTRPTLTREDYKRRTGVDPADAGAMQARETGLMTTAAATVAGRGAPAIAKVIAPVVKAGVRGVKAAPRVYNRFFDKLDKFMDEQAIIAGIGLGIGVAEIPESYYRDHRSKAEDYSAHIKDVGRSRTAWRIQQDAEEKKIRGAEGEEKKRLEAEKGRKLPPAQSTLPRVTHQQPYRLPVSRPSWRVSP